MESIQPNRFNNLRRATAIGALAFTLTGCSSAELEPVSETAYFAIECQDGFEPEITDVSDLIGIGEHVSLECVNEEKTSRPLGISHLRETSENYEHILEIDYDDIVVPFFEPDASFEISTNQNSEQPAYVRLHSAELTAVEITVNQE